MERGDYEALLMSRGNVCAEPVVFSLSAPGPGLPSNKVTQRSTLDLAKYIATATAGSNGDSAANL